MALSLLQADRDAYIPFIETTLDLKSGGRRHRDLTKGDHMNVARSFNNWRKYRQTITELGRMTNRELNDLGINRADIDRVARASFAG